MDPAEQTLIDSGDRLRRVREELRQAGETLQRLRRSGASYPELRQAEKLYQKAEREEAYAGASFQKAQDAYQSAVTANEWRLRASQAVARVQGMQPPPHPMPEAAAAAEFRPVPVARSPAGRGGTSGRLIPDTWSPFPSGYVRTQKMWDQAWRGAEMARELQALRARAAEAGQAEAFDSALPQVAGIQDSDIQALPYQPGGWTPWSPVGHAFGTVEALGGGIAGTAKMVADKAIKAVGQPGMSPEEYQDTWQGTMNSRQLFAQGLLGDDYYKAPYWDWKKHYESEPALEPAPWVSPKGLRHQNVYQLVMDDKVAFDGAPWLQWAVANMGAATTDLIPFFGSAGRVGKAAMYGGSRPVARAAVAGQRLLNNLGSRGAVRRVVLPLATDTAATAATLQAAVPALKSLLPEDYDARLELQGGVIRPLLDPRYQNPFTDLR